MPNYKKHIEQAQEYRAALVVKYSGCLEEIREVAESIKERGLYAHGIDIQHSLAKMEKVVPKIIGTMITEETLNAPEHKVQSVEFGTRFESYKFEGAGPVRKDLDVDGICFTTSSGKEFRATIEDGSLVIRCPDGSLSIIPVSSNKVTIE